MSARRSREFEHAFSAADQQAAQAAAAAAAVVAASDHHVASETPPIQSALHAPSYPGSLVTRSTFDPHDSFTPSHRHPSIVDIPRALLFAPSSHPRRPGSDDEDLLDQSEVETEGEGEGEETYQYDDDGGEEDDPAAVSRIHAAMSQAHPPARALSSDPLLSNAAYRSSTGRAYPYTNNPRTPLLHLQSSNSSPGLLLTPSRYQQSFDKQRNQSGDFTPFTPQTRRNYLQRKIDLVKAAGARARRQTWLCFEKNPFTRRRIHLAVMLGAIALAYGLELVLRKIVATNLYHYRWFLCLLLTTLTFLFTLTTAVIWHRTSILHHLRHHGFPLRFVVGMALLDTVHTLSLVISLGVLPPLHTLILPCLMVPFSLLFRFFATNGERVGWMSLLGSVGVVVGAGMIVVPSIVSYSPCGASAHTLDSADARNEIVLNALLLVIGCIPAAVSAIWKQAHLQHHPMNSALFQVSLAFCSIVWLLLLGPLALAMQGLGSTGVQSVGPQPQGGAGQEEGAVGSPFAASSELSSLTSSGASSSSSSSSFFASHFAQLASSVVGGAQCIFAGEDSIPGDVCSAFFPWLPLMVLALLVLSATVQYLLSHAMRRIRHEKYTASALAGGLKLAILTFEIHAVMGLLPAWEYGRCLPELFSSYFSLAGLSVLLYGVTLGQWQPSQEPMDLDVWQRLEEIAREEEREQARRIKTNQHRGTSSSSFSHKQ
jgi:hypothetical protein